MGARQTRSPTVPFLTLAAICIVGAAVDALGQDTADVRALLHRILPAGVAPVQDFSDVATLWPCDDEDEFDLRRCQGTRDERLTALRRETLGGWSFGILGTYDFQRNAFPIDVARSVRLDRVPEDHAPALLARPTARTVDELTSARAGLPPAFRLVRLWIPFSNPDEAERWREHEAQQFSAGLWAGEYFARAVVLFKVGNTWEFRDPPSEEARRSANRLARLFGVPNARPPAANLRGADFRPLGVVLLPQGRPVISHVIDQRTASDVESLRAAAEAALAAPPPGPLSAETVQSVVRENRSGLRDCYASEVAVRPPTGETRMTVSLVIGRAGVVTRVSVAGDGLPSELIACIEQETTSWRFPASSDGGNARFPVVFSSAPSEPTTPM